MQHLYKLILLITISLGLSIKINAELDASSLSVITTTQKKNLEAIVHKIQSLGLPICDELKKLVHSSNPDLSLWPGYINQLAAHDLTIEDCIIYISEQREATAFLEVIKEWPLSHKQIIQLNNALKNLEKLDQNATPKVIFISDIAPQLQELIKQKAQEFNVRIPIQVTTAEDVAQIARIGRGVNGYLEIEDHFMLEIDPFYASTENFNLALLDATLQHEFVHLTKNHSTTKMMYLQLINNTNFMAPLRSKSFQKWQRAREAYADRVGQVCCKDPRTIGNMALLQEQEILMCRKQGIDIYDKSIFTTHPTPFKRFIWGDTILQLRKLEEQRKYEQNQ